MLLFHKTIAEQTTPMKAFLLSLDIAVSAVKVSAKLSYQFFRSISGHLQNSPICRNNDPLWGDDHHPLLDSIDDGLPIYIQLFAEHF